MSTEDPYAKLENYIPDEHQEHHSSNQDAGSATDGLSPLERSIRNKSNDSENDYNPFGFGNSRNNEEGDNHENDLKMDNHEAHYIAANAGKPKPKPKGIVQSIIGHLFSKQKYKYKTDSQGRPYYVDNVGIVHYVNQGLLLKSVEAAFGKPSTYAGIAWSLKKGGWVGSGAGIGYGILDDADSDWWNNYVLKSDHWMGTDGSEH